MNIKICICDDASEEREAIKTLVSYNWYIGAVSRLASGITGFRKQTGTALLFLFHFYCSRKLRTEIFLFQPVSF